MALRTTVAGILLAVLTTACGSSGPPNGPGPIVTPPPDPGPGPAPIPAAPPTLGITRILTFGDSMTEGTTSATYTPFTLTPGIPQSYPFKLQLLLSGRYSAQTITVSNAGRAGRRAMEDRDRLSGAMSEAKPELLILIEGANDLNLMNSVGSTDVSPVVAAIEDMVRDSLARGAQVIVTTLPPQRENSPKGGAGPLLAKFNRDMKTMAAKKGATLIDLNAMVPLALIGQDGLHPTESAYEMIAGLFFDAIKSRFELVTAARQ